MRSSSIACADHRAPSWDEPGGIRDLLTGLTEFGWKPVLRGRQRHRAQPAPTAPSASSPPGQFELSGAPLENLHQTCAEAARHLDQCKADRRPARARLPRHRHVARQDPRRPAGHAQGPLRDHAQLHAEGRQPRPRHDAAHLHHPGQPRLFVRSRHGEEVPRRPGAAAGGDGAVRQLAVHRGQAQRLSRASAATSGKTPTPTAPACCRSCSRMASATSATATIRSTCRCTSCSATASTSTSPARSFRDFLDGRLPRAARREAAASATGSTISRPPSPKCG